MHRPRLTGAPQTSTAHPDTTREKISLAAGGVLAAALVAGCATTPSVLAPYESYGDNRTATSEPGYRMNQANPDAEHGCLVFVSDAFVDKTYPKGPLAVGDTLSRGVYCGSDGEIERTSFSVVCVLTSTVVDVDYNNLGDPEYIEYSHQVQCSPTSRFDHDVYGVQTSR